MKRKLTCPSELAYALGILILACGTALMEKADLGMSMVVAPAYLLYLKLSRTFSFFTFGMAEYVFRALLLILLSLVLHRAKKSYLFSFVTALIYGLVLDLFMGLAAPLPADTLPLRILYYLAGMVLGSAGVAFFFRTYIAPEAYELFVRELCQAKNWPVDRVKTVYDCVSCLLGIALSFAFFGPGHFEGVRLGTIVCALVNGFLIGRISGLMDKALVFQDAFRLRGLFDT